MRVLIVKLSSLGDVVHTLPVVADVRALRPAATIDWVVEPAFAPLLARVDGVAGVIECALRDWSRRGRWRADVRAELAAFVRRLRATRYDAVLELQGLTKAALVGALARGPTFALANRTEGASHEWPARALATHAIRVESRIHALDRARVVVARALGDGEVRSPPRFGLVPRPAGVPADRRRVVFIHGTSRADKLWPEASWIELGTRLLAAGRTIALPQAGATERERAARIAAGIDARAAGGHPDASRCELWPAMDIGAFVDRLATTGGAIGVDSGPSHIATALGLPHVQLYNVPTAWRTGPQAQHGARHQVAVEGRGGDPPNVDAAWAAWQAVTAHTVVGEAAPGAGR